ncbi:MAG: hypothetical protein ACJ72F_00945 [Nitrososphaeraceae archaeon]
MERYARIIQESQYDLGLEVSSFDNIGMPASSFLWQIVQKDENKKYQIKSIKLTVNTNKRFTDDNAYRENFTDDNH